MVGDWMGKIGFSKMYKACVFGKISGKVWLNYEDEEEFLNESFGMDTENDILKVKMERKRVMESST